VAATGAEVGVLSFLDDSDEKTTVHRSEGHQEETQHDYDTQATVIEDSPEFKLEMVSMKPNTTPTTVHPAKAARQNQSPIKPVLRPLSSLAGPGRAPQNLGTFAPAKLEKPRSVWLYLGIALLLGALLATAALSFADCGTSFRSEICPRDGADVGLPTCAADALASALPSD
jgi:hypothetical protein